MFPPCGRELKRFFRNVLIARQSIPFHETLLSSLEEEGPDALEVAKKAHAKGKEEAKAQGAIKDDWSSVYPFHFVPCQTIPPGGKIIQQQRIESGKNILESDRCRLYHLFRQQAREFWFSGGTGKTTTVFMIDSTESTGYKEVNAAPVRGQEAVKMANTMERRYMNHLRDSLKYTREVHMDRINQGRLAEALSAIEKGSTLGRERVLRMQREQDLREEHRSLIAQYGENRSRFLWTIKEVSAAFPESIVYLNGSAARLSGLEGKVHAELGALKYCVERLSYVRSELSTFETENRSSRQAAPSKPEELSTEQALLDAMGIEKDPCLYETNLVTHSAGIQLRYDVIRSARWLLRKLSHKKEEPGSKCRGLSAGSSHAGKINDHSDPVGGGNHFLDGPL